MSDEHDDAGKIPPELAALYEAERRRPADAARAAEVLRVARARARAAGVPSGAVPAARVGVGTALRIAIPALLVGALLGALVMRAVLGAGDDEGGVGPGPGATAVDAGDGGEVSVHDGGGAGADAGIEAGPAALAVDGGGGGRAASGEPQERSVAAELRLVEAAHAAVIRGDAGAALRLLGEHVRRFPEGALVEDREALRVRALLAQGRVADARAAITAFAERFPRSLSRPGLERAVRDQEDGRNAPSGAN